MSDGLQDFFQRVEAEPSAEFTDALLARLRTEFDTGEPAGGLSPDPSPGGRDAGPGAADDAQQVVLALTTTDGRGERGGDKSRSHAGRRRWTPVAAAVLVVVAAATTLLATRHPGDDHEQNVNVIEEGPGLPPTVARLNGIWLEDPGTGRVDAPLMARFETDGRFSLGGVLEQDSWTYGTYEVDGRRINFTVTGGKCSSRDTFTWDAAIVAEGRLRGVHEGADSDEPEQLGNCTVPVGEPRDFTRISPASPAATTISAGSHTEGPVTSTTTPADLHGFWLMEATGHLLRLDVSGGYRLDDGGDLAADPDDAGTIEIGSQTLTFTTSGRANECAEGDTMVWSNLRVEDGQLQGVVDQDSCDRGLAGEVTLLFLDVDAP